MEVETPVLSQASVTDPHIQSLETRLHLSDCSSSNVLYLQTSPEFHMKRLLCAGSGPIYQISRVFRNGESGRFHNPEFTLLEWYRPGYDHYDLMDELGELLAGLGLVVNGRIPYADVFMDATGLDPHSVTVKALGKLARERGLASDNKDRCELLDFIFSHCVVPELETKGIVFIYDFPEPQAALAKLTDSCPARAERFELFVYGIEVANGFHELCDAEEQLMRFEGDLQRRSEAGKKPCPVDMNLIAALKSGLPPCAGVAVGIDRLLMVLNDARHIDDVIAFPVDRA